MTNLKRDDWPRVADEAVNDLAKWTLIALLGLTPLFASCSWLSGCGPATEARGALVEHGKALAYSGSRAALSYFDGRAAAAYQAKSEAVRAVLKASGGSLGDYDASMAEWSRATGYTDTEARLTRATAALEIVRQWLAGETGAEDVSTAIDDAAEVLTLLLTELDSQGVTVPAEVRQGVEATRTLAGWVTR